MDAREARAQRWCVDRINELKTRLARLEARADRSQEAGRSLAAAAAFSTTFGTVNGAGGGGGLLLVAVRVLGCVGASDTIAGATVVITYAYSGGAEIDRATTNADGIAYVYMPYYLLYDYYGAFAAVSAPGFTTTGGTVPRNAATDTITFTLAAQNGHVCCDDGGGRSRDMLNSTFKLTTKFGDATLTNDGAGVHSVVQMSNNPGYTTSRGYKGLDASGNWNGAVFWRPADYFSYTHNSNRPVHYTLTIAPYAPTVTAKFYRFYNSDGTVDHASQTNLIDFTYGTVANSAATTANGYYPTWPEFILSGSGAYSACNPLVGAWAYPYPGSGTGYDQLVSIIYGTASAADRTVNFAEI